jgi:taurine dioxygenase
MTYQSIEVEKLTPHVGAEIGGIDLTRPLSDQQVEDVHAALVENLVIFFRDQALTVEQHVALGRRFGELTVHPASRDSAPGHPEVMVIKADETSRFVAGEHWHSDVSCSEEPPMGSILHLHQVPPVGGDTLFASMYAVYESLSEPIRRMLDGLTAVHDGGHYYEDRYEGGERAQAYPRAEHPVVCIHPVTGRRLVFVNRTFTTRITQLSRAESDAVLELLYRLVETPEFQCRFTWRPNSVAFWDNRCVQHQAVWDYFPERRYGHRVTVKGGRPRS